MIEYGVPIATFKVLCDVHAFDANAYKEVEGVSFFTFHAWWRSWPCGLLCAISNNEPFSVVGLFPVTEEWTTAFLERHCDEDALCGAVMLASSRKHWYLSRISSKWGKSGLYSHLPNILGYTLLRWAEHNAPMINNERIVFVSEGRTLAGLRLLNRKTFGFELASVGDAREGRPRFRKQTDITEIKNLLLNHKLFSRCGDLRHDTLRSSSLRGYPAGERA